MAVEADMPGRDLLTRFRPVGAPGAAGPVGVPAPDDDSAAVELAPLFGALEPTLQACERLRTQARQTADQLLAQARQTAAQTARQADRDAAELRAAAAARVRHASQDDARALLTRAEADADRIRATGLERRPVLVREVLTRLRADLGLPSECGRPTEEAAG
jgi:vacuolar-type H+-ATPase subunit H